MLSRVVKRHKRGSRGGSRRVLVAVVGFCLMSLALVSLLLFGSFFPSFSSILEITRTGARRETVPGPRRGSFFSTTEHPQCSHICIWTRFSSGFSGENVQMTLPKSSRRSPTSDPATRKPGACASTSDSRHDDHTRSTHSSPDICSSVPASLPKVEQC